MDGDKDLLLTSAARLYTLGVDLEGAREKLRGLVECGAPYESTEVIIAYEELSGLRDYGKA